MCQYNIIMCMKNKETTTKVGMNIRLRRTRLSMTQEELAFRSGVSNNMISNVERGIQSPTVETVAAIAKVLDIELYKLFIFED